MPCLEDIFPLSQYLSFGRASSGDLNISEPAALQQTSKTCFFLPGSALETMDACLHEWAYYGCCSVSQIFRLDVAFLSAYQLFSKDLG